MPTRKPYPSDLSDAEWQLVDGSFPTRNPGLVGRPREHDFREIVNAILYLVRTGCQWRHLPHDFPPYTTVSDYYHQWRKNGLLEQLEASLRRAIRLAAGKEETPSAVIVDSQSTKTTEKGGRRNLRKLSAMTPERRSKAASAISLLTRSG